MSASRSPTVRRRELGALLRAYRNRAGLSVKRVTDELDLPVGKVSRIESGERYASPNDISAFCDLYGITDEAVREHLRDLARASREPGWWRRYELEPAFQTYVGLEVEASEIREFQSSTIPGLLQTEAYAYEVLRIWRPSHSPEQRERTVAARMKRQTLLTGERPTTLQAVLDESAVRRQVGGPAVMREQLLHLASMCDLPTVDVRVLPFTAGAHRGMDSIFILLDFPDSAISSIVYIDGLVGQLYIEQPDEVRRYREVFGELIGQSMTAAESVGRIREIAREL